MLKNVLLKAGEYTEIATQGKFLNVVLAAGEIEARIRMTNDQTFQTILVSGMAFPVPQGFSSVAFKSKVTQQTKIWLGNLPLTYSPIDAKAVGSSALSSTAAQVFSGGLTQLLAAETGRNRVTLTPKSEIFIGGPDVSIQSGIRVGANETFQLQTQGAIFAFENSGDYKKSYTAAFTDDDLSTRKDFDTSSQMDHFAAVIGADEILACGRSATYLNRLSRFDMSIIGTVNLLGKEVSGDYSYTLGDFWYLCTANASYTQVYMTKVNLRNLTVEHTLVKDVFVCACFDVYEDVSVFVEGSSGVSAKRVMLSAGVGFEEVTEITGVEGYCIGVVVTNTGKIIATFENQLAISTDKGVTWRVDVISAKSRGLTQLSVDRKTGYIFYVSDAGILRSKDDGATWFDIPKTMPYVVSVIANHGTVLAIGDGLSVSNDSGDNFIAANASGSTPTSTNAMMVDGKLYAARNLGVKRLVSEYSGSELVVGGLPVAVMSEVN